MCGIAGLIDYSGRFDLPTTVTAMVNAIRHRGPDGCGHCQQLNCALGHARLSIIDLEGGRQPMSTPDGKVHLTYNGEIYNYRELRRELQKLGVQFRTNSDTEVVLYAYQQWGRHCVDRFEGMFAFAVLDLKRRELLLARDHFGIKPLLYRRLPGSLAFASEIQALRALPDWDGEIDLRSIDLFLRYQYIPAPLTAYRNICKLPAGHRMIVRLDEPVVVMERYWQPDFSQKRKRRESDLLHELDAVLRDSVSRHLVADVPFGAFLSGGIDSSLVVGYMTELLQQPVRTFSIGFDEGKYSETQYARIVAAQCQTQHHEEVLQADAFSALPELVRHYGEPYGDQSAVATWAVCRLARRHVPMVLSGDGGDELFAGYGTYHGWLTSAPASRPAAFLTGLRGAARRLKRAVRRSPAWTTVAEDPLRNWFPIVGRFHQRSQRSSLWRPELRFLSDLPDEAFHAALSQTAGFSRINQAQYLDLETFLPEDILAKVDIASMSVGLEVRPPLIDRRVFDFAASIPETQLCRITDEFCGKLPLKHLVSRRFGQEFAFRRKQGFEIPLEHWLRGTAERRQQLLQTLTDSQSGLQDWFCTEALQAVVEHGSAANLWLLCILREWRLQQRAA